MTWYEYWYKFDKLTVRSYLMRVGASEKIQKTAKSRDLSLIATFEANSDEEAKLISDAICNARRNIDEQFVKPPNSITTPNEFIYAIRYRLRCKLTTNGIITDSFGGRCTFYLDRKKYKLLINQHDFSLIDGIEYLSSRNKNKWKFSEFEEFISLIIVGNIMNS